jgi:hypothetical protein
VAAEKERKNKAMMKNEEIAKKTSKRVESFFSPLLGFWFNLIECKISH